MVHKQRGRLCRYLEYTGPKRTKTKKWQWKLRSGDRVLLVGAGGAHVPAVVVRKDKYNYDMIIINYDGASCLSSMHRNGVLKKLN